MGGLSKLKEMFVRPEPLLAPMDDPFVQIDKTVTSERLRLRERGLEQGALNLPPPHVETLDAVEAEIVSHVHEVYSRAQIDGANAIRTYDGRLAELTLLQGLSQVGVFATQAVGDFEMSIRNAQDRLTTMKDDIAASYAELKEFREEHGLRRPAHRATSKTAGLGYIMTAWAVETALNSVLLKQNDSMGLLGGIAAAAAIGALNIFVAAMVGIFVWPLTQHRAASRRLLGWVGLSLWLAFVGVWNWGAAHYRDAKTAGLPNPEIEALGLMMGGLDSIYSWALLVAGCGFAVMAAVSAFRMDDPYPGYGRVYRRHEDRCDSYADQVEVATHELKDIRDEALEEASAVRDQLGVQQAERGQILAARGAFARRFAQFGDQLEVIGNALLQDYRTANLSARTTDAPSTFLTRWAMSKSELPPPPVISVSDDDIRAAETALTSASDRISDAFREGVRKFESLEALKRKLEHA